MWQDKVRRESCLSVRQIGNPPVIAFTRVGVFARGGPMTIHTDRYLGKPRTTCLVFDKTHSATRPRRHRFLRRSQGHTPDRQQKREYRFKLRFAVLQIDS